MRGGVPEWLDAAQALPEGTTRKVEHDCGPGECLQINHKPDGWAAYCHRCEYKWFVPRPAETLGERMARLRAAQSLERSATASIELPLPALSDPQEWPLDARIWLYKAGVSNADIEALGFYWNPRLCRVVMPVRNPCGELIYWQARTLDPHNPRKYLNPAADKSALVARYGDGPVIVLTEDILSAYKVSRVGVAGWCLMGTKLSQYVAGELMRERKPVIVFLDPDGAGQSAASKIVRALRAYGLTVHSVLATKDPKLHDREELNAIIQSCFAHQDRNALGVAKSRIYREGDR